MTNRTIAMTDERVAAPSPRPRLLRDFGRDPVPLRQEDRQRDTTEDPHGGEETVPGDREWARRKHRRVDRDVDRQPERREKMHREVGYRCQATRNSNPYGIRLTTPGL